MFRKMYIDEIEEVSLLIYHKNQNHETQSSYMSKKYEHIHKDLLSTFNEDQKHVLISKTNQKIDGVIVASYNQRLDCYDIAGPFMIEDDLEQAKKMLQTWMDQFEKRLTLKFFFNEKSLIFQELMHAFDAHFDQNEYILSLAQSHFIHSPVKLDVNFMGRGHHQKVKIAFDDIFPNIYVSSDEVISIKENQKVIILEHNDDIAGLAYVKFNQKKCSLECFGLRVLYRNKKLSQPFLHAVIDLLFNSYDFDCIDLVVDQTNDKAIKIYLNLGFKLLQTNKAFTFTQ
jgi:ribosomal protein S18 acetylase RimI-like enzyme